ncbi:MAG: hypothetical protein QOI82_2370 [Actinomycetota bacterium]|nr:hypothetical protein [Actinomycetota bacterium]
MFCTLADPHITEASGIVASAAYDNVLYTHNDSGDIARFFAIDGTCHTRATFVLPGVQARDWEDISRGPGGALWLGDIGDNSATRTKGILLHRVAEPRPTSTGTVRIPSVAFRFRYADGPHDAEALLVHPRTGQVVIVTKGFGGGTVYTAQLPLQADVPNMLREVGHVSVPEVTGGDISPDGSHVVLRNYTAAYEWTVKGDDVAGALKGESTRIALPSSPQGEAITYSRDGKDLIVTSEGVGATVQAVARKPAAGTRPAPSARSSSWPGAATAAVVGAVLLLLIGVVGLRRTRVRRAR